MRLHLLLMLLVLLLLQSLSTFAFQNQVLTQRAQGVGEMAGWLFAAKHMTMVPPRDTIARYVGEIPARWRDNKRTGNTHREKGHHDREGSFLIAGQAAITIINHGLAGMRAGRKGRTFRSTRMSPAAPHENQMAISEGGTKGETTRQHDSKTGAKIIDRHKWEDFACTKQENSKKKE